MKPTPESIQAAFDEVQRFAQSAPLFKWAKIEDVEFTEIRYPAPITPDPMPDDGIETIGSMRIKSAQKSKMKCNKFNLFLLQNNLCHTKQKRVVLYGVINTKH
jgi:hypothetical protein